MNTNNASLITNYVFVYIRVTNRSESLQKKNLQSKELKKEYMRPEKGQQITFRSLYNILTISIYKVIRCVCVCVLDLGKMMIFKSGVHYLKPQFHNAIQGLGRRLAVEERNERRVQFLDAGAWNRLLVRPGLVLDLVKEHFYVMSSN